MADRDAWEQSLYRFAAVLLADAAQVREVTLATLEAARLKPPGGGDDERLALFLFQGLRRRALAGQKTTPTPSAPADEIPAAATVHAGRATPEVVAAALHALAEPGRSALTLLLLDVLEADTIAKLLGLNDAEFAAALHAARHALNAALTPIPEAAP